MKKLALIAMILTIGVTCAYAATLKVPWFVDNAAKGAGVPPTGGGENNFPFMSLVYLSSSTDSDLLCTIEYFTEVGDSIGPAAPANTFVVPAFSTVAFRPVQADQAITQAQAEILGVPANPNGQEGAVGVLVPDRPVNSVPPNDNKKNGSLLITYPGAGGELGGAIWVYQQGPGRSSAIALAHTLN